MAHRNTPVSMSRRMPIAVSGSGRGHRLPLFKHIDSYELERRCAGIVRVVPGAARNDEAVARFDFERRLAFDQDLTLPFEDITDLIAWMRVAACPGVGSKLDTRDHSLAAGNRHIRFV